MTRHAQFLHGPCVDTLENLRVWPTQLPTLSLVIVATRGTEEPIVKPLWRVVDFVLLIMASVYRQERVPALLSTRGPPRAAL